MRLINLTTSASSRPDNKIGNAIHEKSLIIVTMTAKIGADIELTEIIIPHPKILIPRVIARIPYGVMLNRKISGKLIVELII